MQRLQRLGKRREGFVGVMFIPKPRRPIGRALGPMQLIEIDVIRLQALQAGIDGRNDILRDRMRSLPSRI